MTPDGWQAIHLGDVMTNTVGGGTPDRSNPDYWGGSIPWATVKDFGPRVLLGTQEHITEKGLRDSASNLVPKDTVVVATRMNVGAVFRTGTPIAINQDLRALVPAQSLSSDYLFYFLQANSSTLCRLATGTTVKGLRVNTLRSLSLSLPPRPEQRKIAAILSSVDAAIEKTQAVIDQVQVVKRALMQQLLTRGLPGRHAQFKKTVIGEIPEEWDSIPLEQFCAQVTDGTHDTPKREKKGIPLITSKNLRNGTLDIDSCYLISAHDFAEIAKRSRVDVGDVLFGMIGTIGNPVIVPLGIQKFAIKNVALFKLDGNLTKARWLVAYLESPMFARTVQQQQTGNAQRFLSLGFLRTLRIPNATKDERQEIVRVLHSMDHRLRIEAESLEFLTRLKSGLMSVLLTGELRVTPDEEIA